MTTTMASPVSFSQAVLLRPAMYTLNGTTLEIIAFLEGYYSGMAKNNPYAAPVLEWEAFRAWLAGQLCVEPAQAFAAFVQQHQSENTTTRTLAESLSTFLQTEVRG